MGPRLLLVAIVMAPPHFSHAKPTPAGIPQYLNTLERRLDFRKNLSPSPSLLGEHSSAELRQQEQ